ncbi:MAG: transporter ATP-binding protein [Parachlamydiales bacterium]|nr:transporter ATP-binding protein [Parachlamydiales bacterium]
MSTSTTQLGDVAISIAPLSTASPEEGRFRLLWNSARHSMHNLTSEGTWARRVLNQSNALEERLAHLCARVFKWVFISSNGESSHAIEAPQTILGSSISTRKIVERFSSFVFLEENRRGLRVASLLILLNSALNFLNPLCWAKVATILNAKNGEFPEELGQILFLSLLGYLGLRLIGPMAFNFQDRVLSRVQFNTLHALGQAMLSHLLKKPLEYHVKAERSDMIFLIQKTFSLGTIINNVLIQLLPTIAETSIAALITTYAYGWEVGATLAVLLPLFAGFSYCMVPYLIEVREASIKEGNKNWEDFSGALENYKLMWECNRYPDVMAEQRQSFRKLFDTVFREAIRELDANRGYVAISYLYLACMTYLMFLRWQTKRCSGEEFLTITGYAAGLASSLPEFGRALSGLFRARPDLRLVFSELEEPEIIDAHPDVALSFERGRSDDTAFIQFDKVGFTRPPQKEKSEETTCFVDLSFMVKRGEKLALVSESGAGKSTLFNLLYRFYTPNSGEISINGQEISKVGFRSLYEHVCLIEDRPSLFKGSIRKNICYGAELTDEEIFTLADSVYLKPFLEEKGLDTDVGAGGKALSAGQQQKVAILRGLAKFLKGGPKPCPILLMDEVTANIDAEGARQILQGIFSIASKEGTTLIMISHDLTLTMQADRIIVLDKGKGVLAEGTHDALLTSCNPYLNLWDAHTKSSPRSPAPS